MWKIMKSYMVTCCLKAQQLGLGDVVSVGKCQSFNAVNSCQVVTAELGSEHFRTRRGGSFVALWAGVVAGSLHGLSRAGWHLFEIGVVNPAWSSWTEYAVFSRV